MFLNFSKVQKFVLLKDKFLQNVKYEITFIKMLFKFVHRENIKLFMFTDCKQRISLKLTYK